VLLVDDGLQLFGRNVAQYFSRFKKPCDLMPELLTGRGLSFTVGIQLAILSLTASR
jgi:hypothetical protein